MMVRLAPGWFLMMSAVFGMACGGDDDDDDGTTADAGVVEQPDARPLPDARDKPDANETPDAAVAPTVEELCAELCAFSAECGSTEPDPACDALCIVNLGDCSEEERVALADCDNGECKELGACLAAQECVICHDECTFGGPLDPGCGGCAATVCEAHVVCCTQAWDSTCRDAAEELCGLDCPLVCGDGFCDDSEDGLNCPADCAATCGDGICSPGDGEDCFTCGDDCGACVCGDESCDLDECATCQDDCPGGCVCHDICVAGDPLDPACGECEALMCRLDLFCCTEAWDDLCVTAAIESCGIICPRVVK